MPADEWLEWLIDQEVAYAGMAARCEPGPHCLFLHAPSVPEYRDVNRALRLRTEGATPESVAAGVVAYFRSRGLPAIAEIDSVAESQGIGLALRRLDVTPVSGDRLLMRYASDRAPAPLLTQGVAVEQIPNETGGDEAREWIETAVADDVGWPDEHLWWQVANCEARFAACRLYLARLDGKAVGACDLFEHGQSGRIESVVTLPEFRGRGVGTALVARAVADSLTSGNGTTYLFTEPRGAAERLYLRLGFVPWQWNPFRQHWG